MLVDTLSELLQSVLETSIPKPQRILQGFHSALPLRNISPHFSLPEIEPLLSWCYKKEMQFILSPILWKDVLSWMVYWSGQRYCLFHHWNLLSCALTFWRDHCMYICFSNNWWDNYFVQASGCFPSKKSDIFFSALIKHLDITCVTSTFNAVSFFSTCLILCSLVVRKS